MLQLNFLAKRVHVVAKIRQQHIRPELIERHARVTGEPVGGDFAFGDHVEKQ